MSASLGTDVAWPLALLLAAPSTWIIAWLIYSETAFGTPARR